MDLTQLEKCIQTAKDAGCPRDQSERFLQFGYIPLPWQWQFHAAARKADEPNGPVDIGVGGARGPGKSHAVLGQAGLDDCQRVGNLKGLFLRQTGVAAKESFDDLVEKVLKGRVPFEKTGNVIKFRNGSRILLGGFHNEDDIDKYIGIEYDFIIVEELNQLSEEKYTKLRGSLRTSKPNWRPRMYTSFNPGGKGHQFVKNRYIIPFRSGNQSKTCFVGSNYLANPYLNKEYIEYLESLTGDLGRAWREGEWDVFAGQYFGEFNYDIHVVEPFDIPHHWKRIIMGDYGYSKPSAVYWGAIDEDGVLYLYRELYVTEHSYEDLVAKIVSLTPHHELEKIAYWVFDPAIWAKKDGPLSGAEKMQHKYKELTGRGLNIIQGQNERIIGWGLFREYLKPFMRRDKMIAKLQIVKLCAKLIETLPLLQHDEHKVEDVDSDGEDHGPDAVRYGIMSRPPSAPKAYTTLSRLLNNSGGGVAQTSYE